MCVCVYKIPKNILKTCKLKKKKKVANAPLLNTRGHETAQAFSSGVRSRGLNALSTVNQLETSGK